MERRTILPFVFELFGFDTYPIDFLERDLFPWTPGYSVADAQYPISFAQRRGDKTAVFEDWLPIITIPGEEVSLGVYCNSIEVSFRLEYRETDREDPAVAGVETRIFHGFIDDRGVVGTYGDFQEFAVENTDNLDVYLRGIQEQLLPTLSDANFREQIRRIVFVTTIEIDKSICGDNQELEELIKRKELLAQEITTGYRGMIHRLIILLYARRFVTSSSGIGHFNEDYLREQGFDVLLTDILPASNSAVRSMQSGFHATRECGWRLLANFGKIEEFLFKKCKFSDSVSDINGFLTLFYRELSTEPEESVFEEYLQKWTHQELVSREVVILKTFEYFIYRTLNNDSIA